MEQPCSRLVILFENSLKQYQGQLGTLQFCIQLASQSAFCFP
ncbi:hypothetical protein HMPREF9393_1586 [Streptococcus sanguinis SK1056]|uniref:Uncharacterized protein n=1 Tax=Streptococcus sanguinis SK1056 TaxID=888820 RepID=F3UDH9_STRSA|nr:hypothetical protein HMPREF9393_1586 [Streptococcus sanguinis SK1056]